MSNKAWDAVFSIIIVIQALSITHLVHEREERDRTARKIDECIEARKTLCVVDGVALRIGYKL